MRLIRNRIVVKVGTSTLTTETGANDLGSFERLVRALAHVHNRGHETVLVTSGAIALGVNTLRLAERPRDLAAKQAAAAVGQCGLMRLYGKFFGEYDKTIAQVLLTSDDMADEERKEHAVNTIEALLKQGVIPVINENDTVSPREIESSERLFGDNDMLSSVVAVLCRAGTLIILSDIDGFYDGDPRIDASARLLRRVDAIDDKMLAMAGGAGSRRGTGGMRTKLQAARLATSQGLDTIIMNGRAPQFLADVMDGAPAGTLFVGRRPKPAVAV